MMLTSVRTSSPGLGNSLSYASPDGTKPASSSQILADTTIPSNNEVVIMSNKKCVGNDCSFVRPGSVSYREFSCYPLACANDY